MKHSTSWRRTAFCLFLCACTAAPDPSAPPEPEPQPTHFDVAFFSRNEPLLPRLRASPFAFFRYVAEPFSQAVCGTYASAIAHNPTVNLHGDLHLEQFAVADDGFGIVDFDDSTSGPPLLDWLRFSTSLWLAAGGDSASATRAIERFVEGYRVGLREPDAAARLPEPAAAKRMRLSTKTTVTEWLDQCSARIVPLDPSREEVVKDAFAGYAADVAAREPDLAPGFLDVKQIGALSIGVGSAAQAKYLARVEGPTADRGDDVILEIKEMKTALVGECMRGNASDPTRVIKTQAKFATSPQRFLGHVQIQDATFYVHAWRSHYRELGVADLRTSEELAEVAFVVGLQLGRGHPLSPASTEHGQYERARISDALDDAAPTLVSRSRALASWTKKGFDWLQQATLEGARPQGPR